LGAPAHRALALRAVQPASPAYETLRRCAAAAQSALFYRCLACWAEDVSLRRVAAEMAREDVTAFARFRARYESSARTERLQIWTSWRGVNAHVRDARDHYVQSAFAALLAQWGHNAPFGTMAYSEFVKKIKTVIDRYGALGWAERFVLRAWNSAPATLPEPPAPKVVPGFRSIIAPDPTDSLQTSYFSWGVPAGRRE
jgi:hypothetical protein